MVYVVLALGFIVGIYALTRFFLKGTPEQIKLVMRVCGAILYSFVLLFFALTGRIVISIILLIPFIMIFARNFFKNNKSVFPAQSNHDKPDQDNKE